MSSSSRPSRSGPAALRLAALALAALGVSGCVAYPADGYGYGYAPAPTYYAPPVYYAPYVYAPAPSVYLGIGGGRSWGRHGGYRR